MASYDKTEEEVNECQQDEEHPWLVDLDFSIGMPCCHGPLFRPNTPVWTKDLSEKNEDRFVKAAVETVRQAFEFARQYRRIKKLVTGGGTACSGPPIK